MSDKHSADSLQRGLKNRHLQMIALGGAIGTGLFLLLYLLKKKQEEEGKQ